MKNGNGKRPRTCSMCGQVIKIKVRWLGVLAALEPGYKTRRFDQKLSSSGKIAKILGITLGAALINLKESKDHGLVDETYPGYYGLTSKGAQALNRMRPLLEKSKIRSASYRKRMLKK